jgi:DNA-binding beta-propeller fold protein YncE
VAVAIAGVTFSPDGALAYTDGTMVRAINTATNTLARFITVGSPTAGVAVSPDGTHVYVTDFGSNSVSVISLIPST